MKNMQSNPFQATLFFSLLTALCLTGGLALAFITGNVLFESLNVHISGLSSGLLALPIVLLGIFGGGALWGVGIARITGGDARRLAKTGALTYGWVVLVVAIILELLFGLITVISGNNSINNSIPLHTAFTLVFVPAASIIAALSSRKVALIVVGDKDNKSILWASGLAAGIGFLTINLLLQSQGWIVGAPGAAERFTMITVMLSSNVGAAVAGGAALGWMLSKAREE